jgi:histone deacetylase 1/2
MQLIHIPAAGKIIVHQRGMITKLIEKYGDPDLAIHPKPGVQDIAADVPNSLLLADPLRYRSPVAALLYLARLTRSDILHTVAVLSTKVKNPTVADARKLQYLLGYLKGTLNMGIRFLPGDQKLRVYCDSSHGYHTNGSGHGGIVITYGSAPIYCKSWRLKIITRSSSESELVALEEASTFPAWLAHLLRDMHLSMDGKPTIYQDNKSTMLLAASGGSFARTKHLLIKNSFVRQGIANKEFRLCHLPTADMLADYLTKELTADTLENILAELSFVKSIPR